jgi:hypothetical protein
MVPLGEGAGLRAFGFTALPLAGNNSESPLRTRWRTIPLWLLTMNLLTI